MLHPVGELPALVYWRRRALVLTGLLALLVGGGWVAFALVAGGTSASDGSGTSSQQPVQTPRLEQVVPSLASVQTPSAAPSSAPDVTVVPAAAAPPSPPAPADGGPCTDDMLGLEIRSPGSTPVGGKPTFELVVTNLSPVSCVRTLDKALQEIVLLDGAGTRIWGSNDCYPEVSSDTRTLAAGEAVAFPVLWGGLSSEPTCTAPRVNPGAGGYVLRGRLDTKISGDATFTLT